MKEKFSSTPESNNKTIINVRDAQLHCTYRARHKFNLTLKVRAHLIIQNCILSNLQFSNKTLKVILSFKDI